MEKQKKKKTAKRVQKLSQDRYTQSLPAKAEKDQKNHSPELAATTVVSVPLRFQVIYIRNL